MWQGEGVIPLLLHPRMHPAHLSFFFLKLISLEWEAKPFRGERIKRAEKEKKKASQAGCFGGREPSSPCFGLQLWGTEKDSGDHSQRGCRDAAVPPRRPAASFPPPPTGAAPPRGGQPSPDAPFSNLLRCGGPEVGEKRAPSPSTCQTRPVRSAPSLRPLPSRAGPRGGDRRLPGTTSQLAPSGCAP